MIRKFKAQSANVHLDGFVTEKYSGSCLKKNVGSEFVGTIYIDVTCTLTHKSHAPILKSFRTSVNVNIDVKITPILCRNYKISAVSNDVILSNKINF